MRGLAGGRDRERPRRRAGTTARGQRRIGAAQVRRRPERELVADDERRGVAVQPRRVRRQPDDRPQAVLADDRPLVVADAQPLRQLGVAANEAGGRVEQSARLPVGRRREQDLRPARRRRRARRARTRPASRSCRSCGRRSARPSARSSRGALPPEAPLPRLELERLSFPAVFRLGQRLAERGEVSDRFHRITPDVRENAEPGAGLSLRHVPLRGLGHPPPALTSPDRPVVEGLRPAFFTSPTEVRKNAEPGAACSRGNSFSPPRGLPNPHPVSISINVTRPKDARPGRAFVSRQLLSTFYRRGPRPRIAPCGFHFTRSRCARMLNRGAGRPGFAAVCPLPPLCR